MTEIAESQPATVPPGAIRTGDIQARWAWVEPLIWTERMLTALGPCSGPSILDEVKPPTGEPDAGRSSRQDRNPTGASPAVTIAQIGHVAMPHPGRGNPPGDAWCKRPGRPVPSGIAVGATWGPSEWGRSKINE